MRRLVTLILLAANLFVLYSIAQGWLDTQPGFAMQYEGGIPESTSVPSLPSGKSTTGGKTSSTPAPVPSAAAPSPEMDYGTEDKETIARFHEFDWYFYDVMKNGVPGNAVQLSNPQDILGNYHVYVLYDPDNTTGDIADMLGNLSIQAGQNGLEAVFDWTYIYYHKNGYGEKEDSSSRFVGLLDDQRGTVSASGPGTVSISPFFRDGETVRAVGTMETKKKVPAVLAIEKH